MSSFHSSVFHNVFLVCMHALHTEMQTIILIQTYNSVPMNIAHFITGQMIHVDIFQVLSHIQLLSAAINISFHQHNSFHTNTLHLILLKNQS